MVKEKAAALEARLKAEEAILKTEDERLRWEALLAKKRRHFRNLHAILRKGKARDEEALLAEMEETASTITGLTGRLLDTYRLLGDSYKRPGALPEYYVTSYQDLSLGDHLGIFEPWDHDHFDRQGNYEGTVRGLRGAKLHLQRLAQEPDPCLPAVWNCLAWRGQWRWARLPGLRPRGLDHGPSSLSDRCPP